MLQLLDLARENAALLNEAAELQRRLGEFAAAATAGLAEQTLLSSGLPGAAHAPGYAVRLLVLPRRDTFSYDLPADRPI